MMFFVDCHIEKIDDYHDEFEIDKSVMEDARKLCMRDLKTFLDNGIELKKESIKQDGADNVVEEMKEFASEFLKRYE